MRPDLAFAALLWCGTRSDRRSRPPCFEKYCAVSSDTKISAKSASTRGLPDSATMASANSLREAIRRSRSTSSCEQRFSIGTAHQAACAARARARISGTAAGDVFSNCARILPVAGSIDGILSTGVAIAAITEILTHPGLTDSGGQFAWPALRRKPAIDPALGKWRLLPGFRSEQRQILRLPAHGCPDTIPPAWMVEEKPFLHRARTHLTIFAEVNRGPREAVRLAARIQPVHVRFILIGARVRVGQRRVDESEDRT